MLVAGFGLHAQDPLNPGDNGLLFHPPRIFNYHLTLDPAESGSAGGGDSEDQNTALAKEAQNPIANLISIPFQNNFNFGVGPNNVCQYVLNFQPVIPISLSSNWNLITRWITPIINQPSPAPGIRSAFGIGDLNPSFFLSPANTNKLTWGIGPTFSFPTATDPMLGNGMWCVGPSVVALIKTGPWIAGALANNLWSFAGWGNKNVNAMLVQPFVNYNFKHWYISASPIITADWNASHDNMWTVPVGGGVGKIIKLGGKLPLNISLAAYYNAVTPKDFGANWQLRFQLQFLFPR
jgi:hypothetical protein